MNAGREKTESSLNPFAIEGELPLVAAMVTEGLGKTDADPVADFMLRVRDVAKSVWVPKEKVLFLGNCFVPFCC